MEHEAVAGIMGLFVGGFMLVWMLLMSLFVLFFVFWIWMIVDCAKRKFKNDNDKVVWILIVVFLNWLGALIYYFMVKKKD